MDDTPLDSLISKLGSADPADAADIADALADELGRRLDDVPEEAAAAPKA
jgi:hypothetical protein